MDLIPLIISIAVSLLVSYFVIKLAVTHALLSHYKTVRLYEKTGEWLPGPHDAKAPRQLPATPPVM